MASTPPADPNFSQKHLHQTLSHHFLMVCMALFIALANTPPALADSRPEKRLFFVLGDTGDCEQEGARRVGQALAQQADVEQATLIELGDLAYPIATRDRLLACHEPHFGRFKQRLAVPGNHDWRDPGARGFRSLFPETVPRSVPLTMDWTLLLIDSNLRDRDWDNQLFWLEKTLQENTGKCLIAAWHHPRWSSGKHGDNLFVAPLWQKMPGHVSLTLHGHDHHFEALPPLDRDGHIQAGGVPSFIVGHGGAALYPPGPQARSSRAHYGRWGFMRLELQGPTYRWIALSDEGKTLDQGEGRCQGR